VLDCNEQTTLDDFGCGILVKEETYEKDDYFNSKSEASNVKVLCVVDAVAASRLINTAVFFALRITKKAWPSPLENTRFILAARQWKDCEHCHREELKPSEFSGPDSGS
jgi:hypothetical protein